MDCRRDPRDPSRPWCAAEVFEKAYDRVVTNDKIVPPKQYLTVEGIKSVLDMRQRMSPGPEKPTRKISSKCALSKNLMKAVLYTVCIKDS
jgi:hypothetical protein